VRVIVLRIQSFRTTLRSCSVTSVLYFSRACFRKLKEFIKVTIINLLVLYVEELISVTTGINVALIRCFDGGIIMA